MGVVLQQLEVVVAKVEDVLAAVGDRHARQLPGFAGQLLLQGIDVVQVDVGVAAGPDELTEVQKAVLESPYVHSRPLIEDGVETPVRPGAEPKDHIPRKRHEFLPLIDAYMIASHARKRVHQQPETRRHELAQDNPYKKRLGSFVERRSAVLQHR